MIKFDTDIFFKKMKNEIKEVIKEELNLLNKNDIKIDYLQEYFKDMILHLIFYHFLLGFFILVENYNYGSS